VRVTDSLTRNRSIRCPRTDVGDSEGASRTTALQAALAGGHDKIVEMLLAKDADVNTQGGYYGNVLQAASAGGYIKIVEMLLAKNVDVNPQGGVFRNALRAAKRHDNIVALLARGANNNVPRTASTRANASTVQLLVERFRSLFIRAQSQNTLRLVHRVSLLPPRPYPDLPSCAGLYVRTRRLSNQD
jgi:ABC-type phosphate/phosphonate transport system substrate-binding protein